MVECLNCFNQLIENEKTKNYLCPNCKMSFSIKNDVKIQRNKIDTLVNELNNYRLQKNNK
jgi:Zn finger protein HypA/HybF involved in hydrogenase expression